MKSLILTKTPALLALVILLATLANPVQAYTGIPTISIVTVDEDTSVTIQTYNFPPSEDFTVRMNTYGTLGIGGTVIETFNSGTGGSFQRTFNIPASLVDVNMIAIRMDSTHGYYSYNWFYNSDGNVPITSGGGGSTTTTTYTGIPTFSILSVVVDTSVTVQTNNFPANENFTVRMGAYGTYASGGTVIETFNSGTGGSIQKTFTIPSSLAGSYKIAIRMDSSTGYYYAYNWFYNNTATTTPTTTTTYTNVVPTFSIVSVVANSTVTIQTYNFPANETFTCRMGAYGTLAVGGTECGTAPTGSGGSFSLTFTIPSTMSGADKIAIRLDSSTGYYYAYNWFYNTSTY